LIDVKGMKAMGNRLSVHAVQSVTLETEHDDEQDVPDPTPEAIADTEIVITPEDKDEPDEAPTAEGNATDDEIDEISTPPKKVDFEITNPDDIDIDDGGQLGLF